MQALSISDDLIVLKFDAVKKLDRNINYLINTNDEKLPTDIEDDDDDNDPSDIPIATVAEEIEPEIDHFGGDLQQLL